MTVHSDLTGYLERPYLANEYLASSQHGNGGMQTQFVIGDTPSPSGMQSQFAVSSPDDDSFNGMQTIFTIASDGDDSFNAMEFKADTLSHKQCGGYLEEGYLTGPYLTSKMCASMGMQVKIFIVDETDDSFNGMQSQFNILDYMNNNGMQVLFRVVDFLKHTGMQFDIKSIKTTGMQMFATLYNTTNLRILCEYPSRGNALATGNNAWGNLAGTGKSWQVNVATDTGPDHEVENLNTDIVEQTWKAATAKAGINLDCDTELAQGVFLDTLAILNHNLTRAATVQLFGSNTSNFSSIAVTRTLEVISEEPNIFHIEDELPNVAYRYWRIAISDPNNNDPVEIGTIIFGASRVFSGECMTDQLELQRKDFADTVNTEGFTSVSNSRAQKKMVRMNFRSLGFEKGNYGILRDIFTGARTTLKCLWIPTPDKEDQAFMSRFAVFAKLSQIPLEKHNSKGAKCDFATFSIEVDESN